MQFVNKSIHLISLSRFKIYCLKISIRFYLRMHLNAVSCSNVKDVDMVMFDGEYKEVP